MTLDTDSTLGVADVCAWVAEIARLSQCRSVEDLAAALGLVLGPVASRAVLTKRFGRVLMYSSLSPLRWQRAMLAREAARYALERCQVTADQGALDAVTEAAKSCVRDACGSGSRAQSSSRLRLGIS